MNRKALEETITLLWIFLISFVVAKVFFGEEFLAIVENTKILSVGGFIDQSPYLTFATDCVFSMLAMNFYLCACKQQWHLNYKCYIILLLHTTVINLCFVWNQTIATVLDLLSLIVAPLILKSNVKHTLVVLMFHEVGQIILIFLRSKPLYLVDTNYATTFLMLFDVYLWLIIYYLYSNMYKEKTLWEWLGLHFSVIKQLLSLKRLSTKPKTKLQSSLKSETQSERNSIRETKLPLRVKLRLHLIALPQYILVLTNLFITAWIMDKYLEAACFAVAFCLLRYRFVNILHCKTTFKCMLLTNGIIFVFIPITLPISNSLFGGFIAAFAVNYSANLIAYSIFRETEKKELLDLRKEKHDKDIYKMSESDLRKHCQSYNLDLIDEEIVIQRLIYHRKGKDLYEKIGYSKPQMIRREKQIESKLNIKLKDR